MAENFMRSAKAPTISAGVMMANVIWYITNTLSGRRPTSAPRRSPPSMTSDSPPSSGPPPT